MKKYNRDPSDFEISLFTSVALVNDQEELEALRRKRKILKRRLKRLFIDTLEGLKEKIATIENLGVNKMVISVEDTNLDDPIEIFSKELM